ncbi:MAG: TIGR02147 family protein [Pseudomonadota bacterium]
MSRPIITSYTDIVQYMSEMLAYRKATEAKFSVLKATKTLRRLSPALISLILKGKRRVTLDRVDELSKLLGLTPHERQYLRDWVSGGEVSKVTEPNSSTPRVGERRKVATSHILTDWVHVFVKDAFQLSHIRENPSGIYAALGGIASKKRIDHSIKFLLTHGYLRKNAKGQLVPETPLHSVDQKIPSQKVRKFHKAVLKNASDAIDQHTPDQRYANSMVLALNEESYKKLIELIAEHAESLQGFAENLREGNQLYQVIINVSPTGGRRESV